MLTAQDKIECKEIARQIVEDVLERYNKNHIASCPHGLKLIKLVCISFGIAIGSGIASASITVGIAKLLGVF